MIGKEVELVFWPNSWGNHLREIVTKAGYTCDKEEALSIVDAIKTSMSERWRYKWITDEEVVEEFIAHKFPIKIADYEIKNIWKWEKEITFYGYIFWEKKVTTLAPTAFQGLKKILDQYFSWYKAGKHLQNQAGYEETGKAIASITLSKIGEESQEFLWKWEDADIEMASLKALLDAYRQMFAKEYLQKK
jgi:hypothetical protein